MLDNIIKLSLNNKYLVVFCAIILLVYGFWTVNRMDVDVFPDLTAPTVVIMTDAHGMAPEEVERLITYPVETAVNGATGVRRVRSASSQGFSFVWVEFDWGTDVYKARQVVSEKLISVSSQMPLGVNQPVLAPQTSVMGEIYFIGIQSDSTSMMDLRTIAEWNIKPLLLATEGVAQVTIIGGDFKQYQVLADTRLMMHYNVSLSELADVCQGLSNNSNGGVLRQYGNEYVIRGIARSSDIEELENAYIKSTDGKPIKVRDVAQVKIGPAPKMGYASGNAEPAVIISISKQPGANTLNVTEEVDKKLENINKSLPPDISLHTNIFRQADFINTSVSNVRQALFEGGVFVFIILFLFLGSIRTTIISLLAIPLSLLGTVIVMKAFHMTINTMSLGGMAIAIGSLVDDAIIDVENVYKRLRQNRQLPKAERQSSLTVVFEASREIRASILNATLIIMVAFLPLFFLSGMEGRMLQPLGIAFVVSLFVSLFVAMTVTPVLSKMLLSNKKYLKKYEKEKWITRQMSKYYSQSLSWTLEHKRLILSLTFCLFILSVIFYTMLGRSFLPTFNEGSLTLSVVTKPGTSLEVSNELGQMIEHELLQVPEIESTARRTGRGELDEHSQTTNSAEIDVNFGLQQRPQEEFLSHVRGVLSAIPGIAFTVGQPLEHRIDHMLSGTRANIAIKLFGADLNRMFELGNQIKNRIINIEGLVDVNVEQQVEVPQVQIKAHRNMLAEYGISVGRFNEFVDIAFAGEKMSDIYEGQQRFDLVLRLDSIYTSTIDGLKSAMISSGDGKKVPIEQVAEIVSVAGPSSISRENVQRKIVVSANVSGRDLRGVVKDIQANINASVVLPEGYRIEYGGQFESEAKASQILMLTSIIAIFIIFLLLYQEFKEFKLAGIILLNLPMALIGGVFAIWITSGILSIPAIIGFITLFGIATRNGILLISNYQKLLKQGLPMKEIVIAGSADRLNAILMTALTAALALVPMAVKGDLPGNEIQSPMAIVILGGLLTSTALNMYILPAIYSVLSSRRIIKMNQK